MQMQLWPLWCGEAQYNTPGGEFPAVVFKDRAL